MHNTARHVGVVVKDLEKSINFWTEVIGLRIHIDALEPSPYIDRLIGIASPKLRTVKLIDDNKFIIELLEYSSFEVSSEWSGSLASVGLTHIALTVDDLDRLTTKLKIDGYEFISEIQYPPSGLVKVVFVKGPENLMLELVEELKQK